MNHHSDTGLLYRRYEIKHGFRGKRYEEYERPFHGGNVRAVQSILDLMVDRWTAASGFRWNLTNELIHAPWGDGEPTGTASICFEIPSGRLLWKMNGVPHGQGDEAEELLWKHVLEHHPNARFVTGGSSWPAHGEPFNADKSLPYPMS